MRWPVIDLQDYDIYFDGRLYLLNNFYIHVPFYLKIYHLLEYNGTTMRKNFVYDWTLLNKKLYRTQTCNSTAAWNGRPSIPCNVGPQTVPNHLYISKGQPRMLLETFNKVCKGCSNHAGVCGWLRINQVVRPIRPINGYNVCINLQKKINRHCTLEGKIGIRRFCSKHTNLCILVELMINLQRLCCISWRTKKSCMVCFMQQKLI